MESFLSLAGLSDLKKREPFMKDPSPELSRLKGAAERDVCMQLPFQTPLILQSSQPDHGLYISTHGEMACARKRGGREGAGSDTPGV